MPTIEEFGKKIKEKYPQYSSVNDRELGQKFLEKHPEYSDRVFDTDPNEQAKISGEEPGGVGGALKRGWQGLKDSLNKRVENTGNAINADQSKTSKVLQVAGQGFGTIGDVIGAGVGTAASAITPDGIEKKIKSGAKKGVEKILATDTIKNTIESYKKFKESHPEAAGNVEAVGNIADALLNAVGVGAGAKGAKIAGKAALETGEQAVSKTIQGTKRVASVAKDKALSSRAGEAISDIVSPLDNTTKKVVDPFSSVPEEKIANIPKETIREQKQATSGKLDYYLNKARRATQNPSLPSPLEFAGKKAEEALGNIGAKLSKYGKMKKAETEKFAKTTIEGVQDLRTKFMDNLQEAVGIAKSDDGFIPAPGRNIAVSDPSDLKVIETIESRLAQLGESPTFRQVDDTVDFIQDILYKRKANLAVPINSKVEAIAKRITGELNGKLKQVGGKAYQKANQRLSSLIDTRDNLNKALGMDASKGGSLMKRVFSPSDGGTKALFREIKKITGIDLNEEATLAKFAMEEAGDARQANLLEQLELVKNSLGAGKGSFLTEAVKNIALKAGKSVVGGKLDRVKRMLNK